jgi:aspartate kinase
MKSELKVFKFGGASLKDTASFLNVANILKTHTADVVVLSASGKITDKLESLIQAYSKKSTTQQEIWSEIKSYHLALAASLLEKTDDVFDVINDLFVEIDWVLDEEPSSDFNYCYDQIIGIGELLSTRIMHALLLKLNMKAIWIDARDIITTDDNYREGWVYWSETNAKCKKVIEPHITNGSFVVIPGFIGSTIDNNTVSLGREGSDYSAAILSHCLNAHSLTIWKDVSGVYNADPRFFTDAVLLPVITYQEAIEMTYYGAKVIHLKTIKPLQAKNIPLKVKSFIQPELDGTFFGGAEKISYPPIIIKESNQILLTIEPKDYSFIAEKDLSFIFNIFHEIGFQVNFIQNTGLHLCVCGSCPFFDASQLDQILQPNFMISIKNNVNLMTIRHYTNELKIKMMENLNVLVVGDINGTFQMIYMDIAK